MSDMAMGMAASAGVALTVLTHLKSGKIDEAIARCVDKLTCKDHGMGLAASITASATSYT